MCVCVCMQCTVISVCVCVGVTSTELKPAVALLSLGEQAMSLTEAQQRLEALRRVTSTAQVLLGYSMVLTALSQTASM